MPECRFCKVHVAFLLYKIKYYINEEIILQLLHLLKNKVLILYRDEQSGGDLGS